MIVMCTRINYLKLKHQYSIKNKNFDFMLNLNQLLITAHLSTYTKGSVHQRMRNKNEHIYAEKKWLDFLKLDLR